VVGIFLIYQKVFNSRGLPFFLIVIGQINQEAPHPKSNRKGREVERRNEVVAFVVGFLPLNIIIKGTLTQQQS
jgi:hypothetical protein